MIGNTPVAFQYRRSTVSKSSKSQRTRLSPRSKHSGGCADISASISPDSSMSLSVRSATRVSVTSAGGLISTSSVRQLS